MGSLFRAYTYMILYAYIQSRGHSEDVLCVAVGSPNLMATSSFDGEVQ